MASAYRLLSCLIAPLVPLWLFWRRLKGKEDPARKKERLGFASVPRPLGKLLWLHAASVGEANSVLLLVKTIRDRFPHWHILLTTGTVTSARLMQKNLPPGAIHHYVPVDTPKATLRFIDHWRPNLAFWVESELWPNLIAAADEYECFMGVINARMSERSFHFWHRHPAMIRRMLQSFDCFFAQSKEDAQRLELLGAQNVMLTGNIKYDAALLPCDEAELLKLKSAVGARPLWVAASTHPGEEEKVARAHALLSARRPALLTIVVPRHPERGPEIAALLSKYGRVALRSKKEPLAPHTVFYVADTLGELGLFYRLTGIVFMGGSLVTHGGQNPLEPARLACAIVTGPHTHNFALIYEEMEKAGACLRAGSAEALAAAADTLMNSPAVETDMQNRARKWVETQSGAAERLLKLLSPLLAPS